MEILQTDVPAKLAGEQITTLINEHKGDTLCLLAGGSALAVVGYINPEKSECRTIFMMGDERVSGEGTLNNFLQLQVGHSAFLRSHEVIDSSVKENETEIEFANRMSENIFSIQKNATDLQVISLQGIGTDGHTAGIFPLDEESFQETYRADSTYVPLHVKGLTIDSRASITPTWILNQVDTLIGFAVGTSKSSILQSLRMDSTTLHERPAELFKLHKNATIYTDQAV